jgi:ABC-type uncharacterized transport system substrate-binding protein
MKRPRKGSGAPVLYCITCWCVAPCHSIRRGTAFQQGLKEQGFVENQNVTVEYRWAYGDYNQLPVFAADFVRQNVAVIAATGGQPSPQYAMAATRTIPIVFTTNGDPALPHSESPAI